MQKLKLLIEETYVNGGDRPVVLVGHSMGGLYMLHFAQTQTEKWKQKYIKAFVSIGTPYGGSVNSLYFQITGTLLLNFFILYVYTNNFIYLL